MTGTAPGAPAASASSVETPASGTESDQASPLAAARPMRIPVKLPGPIPTARLDTSPGSTPASRTSTSPSRTSAVVVVPVAVSNARISIVDRDRSVPVVNMPQAHPRPGGGQNAGGGLRPLHEHDGVVEVRLQIPPLRRRDLLEAEEVEMRDVDRARVAVADRVGGTGHRSGHAEGVRGSADEGGLAGSELSRDCDNVPALELPGEAGRDSLGFGRRRRRDLHRDSTVLEGGLEKSELDGRLGGRETLDRLRLLYRSGRLTEQLREAAEVLLEHLQHRRRIQRGGGMVERIQHHLPPA